jgi:cytochrome oxidase Cu insertion factor (SCO1/SenC/PrrC family)
MRLTPRAKLLLLVSLFMLPIVASLVAYRFFRPEPTANYGELLLPPATVTSHVFGRDGGDRFGFSDLRDKWVLVASDSGACAAPCVDKLATMRQVRLALGRNASRIVRVFVVDDLHAPDRAALGGFEGMVVATTPPGMQLPPGAANDRAHIYLVDPRGNVILRWPAKAEMRRMYKDLERLLKASQIG